MYFNSFKPLIFSTLIAVSGLISCKKEVIKEQPSSVAKTEIIVTDESGAVQGNSEVKIYLSENDLLKDTLVVQTLITDAEGRIVLEIVKNDTLYAIAGKGQLTSEFSSLSFLPEVTGSRTVYRIKMRQPTKTEWLCGHGSKKWFMDGYTMNGSYSSYPVTSVLYEDGTWTDSNGRSGNWQFANNETQLIYDYFGNGMNLTFTITEFNEDFINLYFNQMGYSIGMSMTAVD